MKKRSLHKAKSVPSKTQHIAPRYVPGEVFTSLGDLLEWCGFAYPVYVRDAVIPAHVLLLLPAADLQGLAANGQLRGAMLK